MKLPIERGRSNREAGAGVRWFSVGGRRWGENEGNEVDVNAERHLLMKLDRRREEGGGQRIDFEIFEIDKTPQKRIFVR